MAEQKKKKLSIKLVRGYAAASKRQSKVLESLGLRRTNAVVEHFGSATIMGMVKKVDHLVQVEELV
ncbi:MAG: 50S ribosomal protein L30 [Candidatus Caenarcaniphilales bacterium]|nr:50S ribosomal protein L30 [Candidatus Caenarcaniphilales bacterium]